MMGFSNIGPLIWQRMRSQWWLTLTLGAGVLLAATLMAISPVYLRVMNDLGLQHLFADRTASAAHNGYVVTSDRFGDPDSARRYAELSRLMSQEIGWFTESEVRYAAMPLMPASSDDVHVTEHTTLLRVTAFSDIEDHVRVIEGRLPEPTNDPTRMEVLMPVESAHYLDMRPGDSLNLETTFDDCNRPQETEDPAQLAEIRANFNCTPSVTVDLKATFIAVGFIERADPEDPFWTAGNLSFATPFPTRVCAPSRCPIISMTVPEQTFFQALPAALPGHSYEFHVTGFANTDNVNFGNLDEIQASLETLREQLVRKDVVPNLSMATALQRFDDEASFNQVVLLVLLLQVVGLAGYFVVLVASLLAERRAEEIAMLRSRGATTGQLVAVAAAESLSLGIVATLLAPFLASAVVAALGLTPTFRTISGDSLLPYVFVPASFGFAVIGAAIAALISIGPAYLAARTGMAAYLRTSARPGRSLIRRYYLDVALLGLAALAFWQLDQQGSVFDSRSVGGWSADPLLLASPLILIAAIGALVFRLLPLLLGLATRLFSRVSSAGIMLGLWQVHRSPARYTHLTLLVVMAAAIATFAATYGETLDQTRDDRARYAVGTDVRLTGLGELQDELDRDIVAQIESAQGVGAAATAHRLNTSIGPLPIYGTPISMLALDPLAADDLLWFRDDFAAEELRNVLLKITGSTLTEHGLALPGQPQALTVWANPTRTRIATTLWARTLDANGVYRNHQFGKLDFEGYQQLEAPIDADAIGLQYPIRLVGLLMTQPAVISDQSPTVFFDDIAVIDSNGAETVIEDFEGQFTWQILRTATRLSDEAERVGAQFAQNGEGAARFDFLTGTTSPVSGLILQDADIPLPAIVSQHHLDATGRRIGDRVELVLGKHLIPLEIRAVVDYFPTMYDSQGGFVIVNQDHLYHYAGIIDQRSDSRPSEAWISFTSEESQRQAAQAALYETFNIAEAVIIDRETVLADIDTDPVVKAGGTGILLVAVVAAFTILAMGSVLTLWLSGQARSVEVAVIRAIGISRRQLLSMITLEYTVVVLSGLVIGVIAGLRISGTMLGLLDVTETGATLVPPVILTTQWAALGLAFALLAIAFAGGVIALGGYYLRLPVSRIIRRTR